MTRPPTQTHGVEIGTIYLQCWAFALTACAPNHSLYKTVSKAELPVTGDGKCRLKQTKNETFLF